MQSESPTSGRLVDLLPDECWELAASQPIGRLAWTGPHGRLAVIPVLARELIALSGTSGGVHTLSTTHDSGVGLQVMGFGHATSYYYPGGLNLKLISAPPVK